MMHTPIRKAIVLCILALCMGCSDGASQSNNDAGAQPSDTASDAHHDDEPDAPSSDVDASVICGTNDTVVKASNLESIEGCEVVLSTIQLVDYYESQVSGVEQLRRAEYGLVFHRTAELNGLSSFGNLEFVGRILSLHNMPKLTDLSGFSSLTEVGGTLTIYDVPLADLSDLAQLESTAGLEIGAVPNLDSLEGLQQLSLIDGDLSVFADQISREELTEFLERVEVTGEIKFNGQPW